MQKVNSKDNISNFEIFAYGITPLAGLGAMLCNTFLTAFWTDTIGISATIVGLILLGSRVFDGVSDLIIGGVIDKTHTRYGKAKPWFLVGALGSLVLSVLAFAVPDIGMQGKIIYSTIIYILLVCIFGTMNIPKRGIVI